MRIKARLEEDAVKLEALKQLDHHTTTEIVKEAFDVLYRQKLVHPQGSICALLGSDFIACAEGPEDLSENYKQELPDYRDGRKVFWSII